MLDKEGIKLAVFEIIEEAKKNNSDHGEFYLSIEYDENERNVTVTLGNRKNGWIKSYGPDSVDTFTPRFLANIRDDFSNKEELKKIFKIE